MIKYRGLLYSAQDIVKKDPGRAKLKSLATAVANFTKPGAQNKGDLCRSIFTNSWNFAYHIAKSGIVNFLQILLNGTKTRTVATLVERAMS